MKQTLQRRGGTAMVTPLFYSVSAQDSTNKVMFIKQFTTGHVLLPTYSFAFCEKKHKFASKTTGQYEDCDT